MKIIEISNVNTKGQVVIPGKIRKQLEIDQNVPLSIEVSQNSIIIKPIRGIITDELRNNSYATILKKTKGKWKSNKLDEKSQRPLELKASERRKKEW